MASPDTPFPIADHLDEVADVVRSVSRLSLQWYRDLDRLGTIGNKDDDGFDPVTEADRTVEAELRAILQKLFPGHAVLGEEYGLTGEGRYRWTIDPIDGTKAFVTGQPMWGTLLGFSIDDVPVAGWMHVPVLDETYVGHGAATQFSTDGEQRLLQTSSTTELSEAIVLCTHPTMFRPGAEAEAFDRVAAAARMVRYSGDCLNYGILAMGLADAVVENQMASYDILPLIPIVEGAGGVVTNRQGDSVADGGFVVAASTPTLHAELLATLNAGSPSGRDLGGQTR